MMMQQSKLEKVSKLTKIDHDMSVDMCASTMIREKVKSDRYAQNLYSAVCNMQWQKTEVMPILKDELWSVSWRTAGRLVSRLHGKGSYMDWYCSGIRRKRCSGIEDGLGNGDLAGTKGYVSEGIVVDEIRADLKQLGWHPVEWVNKE